MKKQEKEFKEELLEIRRVTKVTRGGRQLNFSAAVAIGDGKGKVGFGVGKANEVVGAVEKAVNEAKKNLVKVPIVDGTVPHETKVKYKAAEIMLHPATEGTGIIAGGPARRILELAGYQNILAKRYGSTNIITNAYAAMKAIESYAHLVDKKK